jgi:hypothetical protein
MRPATIFKYSLGFSTRQIRMVSIPCSSKSSASAVTKAQFNRFLEPLGRPVPPPPLFSICFLLVDRVPLGHDDVTDTSIQISL